MSHALLLLLVLGSAAEPDVRDRDTAELVRLTRLHFSSTEDSGTCIASDDLIVTSVELDGTRATIEAVVEQTPIDRLSAAASGVPRVVNRTLEWVEEDHGWRLVGVWPAEERLAASVRDMDGLAKLRARVEREAHLRNVQLSRALIARANRFNQDVAADMAYATARLAMDVSSELDDASGMARALNLISVFERRRGNVAEAFASAEDSLSLAERSGDADAMVLAFNQLGRLYGASRDRVMATAFFRKAVDLEPRVSDRRLVMTSLLNAGTNAAIRGDFLSALQYHDRVGEVAKELGDATYQAIAEFNVAFTYWEQGGDPERALQRFENALAVFRESQPPTRLLPNTLHAIAQCHRALGHTKVAMEYYEQAMEVAPVVGEFRIEGLSASELAEIKLESGDLEAAWRLLERTLQIGERIGDTELQSFALPRMAEIRVRQNDRAGAVLLAENAVNAARKSAAPARYLDALTVASRVDRWVGRTADARAGFSEAIEKYEAMRDGLIGAEEEVQRGFEKKLSPYLELLDLLAEQGDTAEALAIAERSKARLLLDILSNGRTVITKSLTPGEKETEEAFRREIAELNRSIQNESARKSVDETRLADLRRRLDSQRAGYEHFQADLHVRHPELKVARGRAEPLTARGIHALRLPSSDLAVVEFAVTDERTHVFLLGPQARATTSPIRIVHHSASIGRAELERRVEALAVQLSQRDRSFPASARELYTLLFGPIAGQLEGVRILCVIPDGSLWKVPFQALLDSKQRYLVDRFAIFSAPSLSVLALNAGREPMPGAPAGLLAFGNPTVASTVSNRVRAAYRSETLGALPEAETEVRALAGIYGRGHSRVYLGAEATEATAKEEMKQYRILHFATHGVFMDRSPLYSHLLLAPSKLPGGEDGLLEAREMLNLDLRCDLVVLSACETARGRIGAGEGLIGMAWAMFVAGARATVASHWKVGSKSTTEMMIGFHRRLSTTGTSGSRGEAQALRQAQLALMRDPRYRHPYYWSAFVLVSTHW